MWGIGPNKKKCVLIAIPDNNKKEMYTDRLTAKKGILPWSLFIARRSNYICKAIGGDRRSQSTVQYTLYANLQQA